MGLFSFSNDELIDRVSEAASEAWSSGLPAFAHRLNLTFATSKNDPDAVLNGAINAVVAVGWHLRSATPYMQNVGPNNEMVLLLFDRPD